jgi:small subunit ribosomal protein S9
MRKFLSTAALPPVTKLVSLNPPTCDEFGRFYATGRRKTSVARVWIKDGSGEFIVNDKPLVNYFQPIQRQLLLEAFLISKTAGLFDVFCTVTGGGMSGQAGAVRLGISRALVAVNPQMRPILKEGEIFGSFSFISFYIYKVGF